MKNLILFFMLIAVSSSCFATGNGTGGRPIRLEAYVGNGNPRSRISVESAAKVFTEQESSQVYFLKQKQAEIQFATNSPGDNKVEIQSLRPEEISNQAILEGLKRSQRSRQWERIEPMSGFELDQSIENLRLNSLK